METSGESDLFLYGPVAKERERNQRSLYLAEAETLPEFREFSPCSQKLHKLFRKKTKQKTGSVSVSNKSPLFKA